MVGSAVRRRVGWWMGCAKEARKEYRVRFFLILVYVKGASIAVLAWSGYERVHVSRESSRPT